MSAAFRCLSRVDGRNNNASDRSKLGNAYNMCFSVTGNALLRFTVFLHWIEFTAKLLSMVPYALKARLLNLEPDFSGWTDFGARTVECAFPARERLLVS